MPFQHVIRPSLTPLSSHGCQALAAINGRVGRGCCPLYGGGYYGTSEPKEHYACSQVTSPIRLLRHLAFRPVRRRGPLPHTRFNRVLRRWLLCHAGDGGLSPLNTNFQVRSVMDPCTFHPPHDFNTKLCFRSPCKTCRSRSFSALNGLLQSQGIHR